ncbi:MFS transporter [Sulfitobacter sp. PS-8MA]|uniref:MFS transporter n=1 Tax=Sulfitobacter sp. PS-8MA TaxID=3237707 RepID=UPI0034C5D80D
MLLLLSMATVAILAYGPLLMVAVHGTSALIAGYIVAASSVGWTLTAVVVSGAPERQDRMWIVAGMAMTTFAVAGFAYAVPQGPLWLIAVFALLEGGGFGLAWTFILRRVTALVPESEEQRVSGAMPTIQRLGYALGAAYLGIIANASGFLTMDGAAEAETVARWVFLSCVPLALAGLLAVWGLVRRHGYDAGLT